MPKIIAYCTPSLGMVSLWWVRMMASIYHPNNHGKGYFFAKDDVGDEVAEVRNCIVESVLNYDRDHHEVSHLFWLDDDVLMQPGCLLELLHQDRDIVSGVYFLKMEGSLSSPLIYPESGGGTARFIPDQVQEVWGHGMGLTLVKTEVYKRMLREQLTRTVDGQTQLLTDKYGRPRWYHKTDLMHEIEEDEHGLAKMGMTEDTYFLDRASRIGYKPAVVTTKHAFGFHYDAKRNKGYPEQQFNQWQAGQPIVWDTPAGPVTWT